MLTQWGRTDRRGTESSPMKYTKTSKNISQAVREVCLSLPETNEVISHGAPDFRVAGKTFATYMINHHGDGHLALWLRMPAGSQEYYIQTNPQYFYLPPYVGPKGWLGVDLDKGLSWLTIAELVQTAYAEVAPKLLTMDLPQPIQIDPPTETIDPEEFDPFVAAKAQAHLSIIKDICLALPETSPSSQFGSPCFRAGNKNFCTLYFRGKRLRLSVWAGAENQDIASFDDRFHIPAYTGHNGWLDLDIHDVLIDDECKGLIQASYRHFALKRMLKALDAANGSS